MKKILFLLLMLSIASASQGTSYDLKYNLKKGEVYNQHMITNMDMNTSFAGQEMKVSMLMDMTIKYKVMETTDTTYKMEITYQNISVKINSGFEKLNSKMGEVEDMMSSMMSKIKDKPFYLTMNSKGRVLEIKNMDHLFDDVIQDVPNMTEEAKKKAQEQLSEMLSEKSFKGNFEMSSAIYPLTNVKIGDKWKIKSNMHTSVSGIVETEYTLKEVNKDYYLIVGNSVITADKSSGSIKMSGMDMKIDLNGTMSSELRASKSSGWVQTGTMQQKMKAKMTVDGSNQMPAGFSMDMDIIGSMTVSDK